MNNTPLQVPPLSDEVPPKMTETFEQLTAALQQGQAAVQELAMLKPALALAISKLPRKQLKIDAHAELGEWMLQGKTEGNGATILRAVRA